MLRDSFLDTPYSSQLELTTLRTTTQRMRANNNAIYKMPPKSRLQLTTLHDEKVPKKKRIALGQDDKWSLLLHGLYDNTGTHIERRTK